MKRRKYSGPFHPLPSVGKWYRTGDGVIGLVRSIEMSEPPRVLFDVEGHGFQRRKARKLTQIDPLLA